jgi:hypothetical protein
VVGAVLTNSRERKQRRLRFIDKQLEHFYSPMLGIRTEIRMRSELRVRIQEVSQAEWTKLSQRADKTPGALAKLATDRQPEFEKLIDYENALLSEHLLPSYRQMAALFRDNHALADAQTRAYYPSLVEFVELWDRWEKKSIPSEVLKGLGHGEANLKEFYEHLSAKHDKLREKLVAGEP